MGIDSKAVGKCPNRQADAVRLPPRADGTLVGMCMIASDAELRAFRIEKPRGRDSASDRGPDALDAWDSERIPASSRDAA